MKKYLFILSHPPYLSSHVQDALDMILTTAAYDQQVSLLFLDQGIYQLKSQQNPGLLGLKDCSAMLPALEIYNIHSVYVELESLEASHIQPQDLLITVKTLKRSEISALMQQHQVIIPD